MINNYKYSIAIPILMKTHFQSQATNSLIKDFDVTDGPYIQNSDNDCSVSRACRYKIINFGIATAKGSPLR